MEEKKFNAIIILALSLVLLALTIYPFFNNNANAVKVPYAVYCNHCSHELNNEFVLKWEECPYCGQDLNISIDMTQNREVSTNEMVIKKFLNENKEILISGLCLLPMLFFMLQIILIIIRILIPY